MLHGHLDYIARQGFPDSAEGENLDHWASVYGMQRKPATFARRNVTFTGINGSVVPIGTVTQSATGEQFVTDAAATISSGTATVAVTSLTPGTAGNVPVGATLALVAPVAGVDGNGTVAATGVVDGTDQEKDDALAARIISRIQFPPKAGVATDYENWAREVPGVTRVWVFPQQNGPGTVGVAFVRDDDSSIIPDSAEVAQVQSYIDAVKPLTAAVTVFAPLTQAINMTISVTPNTTQVKNAVLAELAEFFRSVSTGQTIYVSQLRERISAAPGETNHVLSVPAADVVIPSTTLAIMGSVTWI
jgi:uncharacterized phage protein gp47/JayE